MFKTVVGAKAGLDFEGELFEVEGVAGFLGGVLESDEGGLGAALGTGDLGRSDVLHVAEGVEEACVHVGVGHEVCQDVLQTGRGGSRRDSHFHGAKIFGKDGWGQFFIPHFRIPMDLLRIRKNCSGTAVLVFGEWRMTTS